MNIDHLQGESIEDISIFQGTLNFKNREEFDEFISSPNTSPLPSFASLASVLNDVKSSDNFRITEEYSLLEDFEGSTLFEVLDESSMVIIDSSLYYLDFESQVVAVTKDFELKEDMLMKDYDNENIQLYGFEDEVLDLIENGVESTVNARTMLFCSDRKAS